MPALAPDIAERIAHAAHEICPYSKATRGDRCRGQPRHAMTRFAAGARKADE
ncbi:hypothetical protein [Lysobacter gummosus]|uniref:hypothetical protein n=1 Tax=Lysobacter gummosus TaxID=262324 RepID=UPI001F39EC4E|nr:hypothetical protein [Lysobacter gummosus]UJQ28447.1 hypothetical protein L2D09_24035 [Lysobacter gummosus]